MNHRNIPANIDRPPADIDRAQQLAVKLEALLCNTYGCSGDAFRGMNDTLQDNYLWACGDLAGELVDALDARVEASDE